MNEECINESAPNSTFPGHVEDQCEGNLMFATTDEPESCISLCKPDTTEGRAINTPGRRGWTKFTR